MDGLTKKYPHVHMNGSTPDEQGGVDFCLLLKRKFTYILVEIKTIRKIKMIILSMMI